MIGARMRVQLLQAEALPDAPSGVVDFLSGNWLLLIGLLAVGLLAYWAFDERQARGSTIEGVGERADMFFGGVLGSFGSLVMVVLTILTTIGANLVDLTGTVVMVLENGPPLLLVNIAGAVIGGLGLTGVVDVTVGAWLIGALTLTLLALAYRRRQMGASS